MLNPSSYVSQDKLPRHPLVLLALLVLSVQSVASQVPGTSDPERPNILFIYTDDQAPWAMGLTGHPQLETPNIDRIAHEGAFLPNSFTTTPVCTPARAGLATGRYSTELGLTEWISTTREPELGLDPSTTTWMERLQEAGYRTGLVGKWHLGLIDRFHPTKTGYDYFMGFKNAGLAPGDPILEKDGVRQRFEGYMGDILTDHAVDFIKRNQGEPFLLSVHFRAPHQPWLPLPEEDWAPYKSLDPEIPNPDYPDLNVDSVQTMMKQYLASVASLDRDVGRLLDLLKELDLARNTIIIFTSDHGYNMGHNGIWHKGNGLWITQDPPPSARNVPRGHRPNMYDVTLRVPTAVRWPGVIEPGTVVSETITNLDWYPTLLSVARLQPRADKVLRGRNILPLLKGQSVEGWNNDLYAEYSTHHGSNTHMRVYQSGDWKLVWDFLNPRRNELYNLATDSMEAENMIDSPKPEVKRVIRQLRTKLLNRMRAIGDPVAGLSEGPPFQGKVVDR